MKIELFSLPADYGHGANDGSYYPVGLLTIGTYLQKYSTNTDVRIIDQHHTAYDISDSDIVGISANSTLNYKNVLDLAERAKKNGKIVVLGGGHATKLADQILKNRKGIVDFIVRSKGEKSFISLIQEISNGRNYSSIPNLSWRNDKGEIVHNHAVEQLWDYDDYLPLNFELLSNGINSYWHHFKKNIDASYDAIFVVFSHFGCGYRAKMQANNREQFCGTKWCSYCSLDDTLYARKAKNVINEVLYYIDYFNIPLGSKILLKCYGDNVGNQVEMLKQLFIEIKHEHRWKDYQIQWTFYIQSTYLNEEMALLLKNIGTKNLFIGFDSADKRVQQLNGMGTSIKNHSKAVSLCGKYQINIQAAFVVGCIGETVESLDNTRNFAYQLTNSSFLERINTSINVIMPGAPNYDLLCQVDPSISSMDLLPTEELQKLWIKHYCPNLGTDEIDGYEILNSFINEIDALSPGPHSSMGYISNLYRKQFISNSTCK